MKNLNGQIKIIMLKYQKNKKEFMFNISRLKLARQRRGLSSRTLAELAGISPITLSRIEQGKNTPEEATIGRLASVLSFPESFFSAKESDIQQEDGVSFRSMRKITLREKRAAIAAASFAYLIRDWVDERFNLPKTQLFDASSERSPDMVAYELRQYWGLGEQPIGNMIELLESKGIRIFSLVENTLNVDAYSCWRNEEPYIFINSKKTAEHNRFDCAHELGHLILHKHGGSEQGKETEQQANQFASAFLMPENDIRAKLPITPSLEKIIKAKMRWGVSVAALSYRLHKLGILSDWAYRGISVEIARLGYRTSEPSPLPREDSTVWKKILKSLWLSRITKEDIARDLFLPEEEIEKLLFGFLYSFNVTKNIEIMPLRKVENI